MGTPAPPALGITSASPRAIREEKRPWHLFLAPARSGGNGSSRSPSRKALRGGGRRRTHLLREGPAGGREARGKVVGRADPPRPRPHPPPTSPPPRRPRGLRQAWPGPAASPGCCPELVPRPAVLGGGGEEGKEEGRRERRKGEKEGRGGVAAEEAGAAGPGVQRKGELRETRRRAAQTLKSRSGARSPAGSDGGGAGARPRPPPASMPGPTPHLRPGLQVPAGAAAAKPALARHAGSLAGGGPVPPGPPRPALDPGVCWEL